MDLYSACERGQAALARRAVLRAVLHAWWRGRGGAHNRRLVRKLVCRWKLDGLLNGTRGRFYCCYARAAQRRWVHKWLSRWLVEARFWAHVRAYRQSHLQ